MTLIQLEDIRKEYYLGEIVVPVLHGVSLTIERGTMVAIMGASGSGKTTLMNIIGCLDHATSGHYWLDGESLDGMTPDERAVVRCSKIGFVFQSFNLLPRTTAFANVMMPLSYNPTAPTDAEGSARALKLLERVGLGERHHHVPSQLSGGQQQRVAIARSLINDPVLLLADEPTGALDSHTSEDILRLFEELNREQGLSIILVTHELDVAMHADEIIHIKDGLIESREATGRRVAGARG